MRSRSLMHIFFLVVALAGCAPGLNMIDEGALQARLKDQKAPATLTEFSPSLPMPSSKPESTSYRLGVEDVVRISVLNNTDLNTVQPIRPDGKIAFFPDGDLQAAGRTVDEFRDEIVNRLRSTQRGPYRVGIQDVIEISIYEHEDLNTTQSIGPDGTISILPGVSVRAAGMTIDELRAELSKRVSGIVQDPILNVAVLEYRSQPLFISDPLVNVVVEEINSRRVSILGAVRKPGIIQLRSETTLLEAISQVGGLSDDADLRQSMVLRDGEVQAVSLERLFKQGDIRHNVYLQPNDSVFVASTRFNKIYVIGEVDRPGTVTWEGTLNLMEAISAVGGFRADARVSSVLVVKGGILEPTLKIVDAGGIIYRGELDRNIALGRGDIVYVPATELATAERYFEFAMKVMQPILAVESGFVLGKTVRDIITGEDTSTGTTINLGP